MNLFVESHQKLLIQLTKAEVDFIIIGGYSVIFHGYARTTGDIDIWLKPDNANKARLLQALRSCGIEEDSLEELNEIDFAQTVFFKIGEVPERIDFLTKINLVDYETANKEKVLANLGKITIPFLHLNHLILSKLNTGRPQDQADIEMLQKIQKNKKS
ncbi:MULTISPECIES: nucleotidyltransferase [unclassified Imperialibacter]|uniref:nucleotidyltransferase n=1 Tax=unclassified Imperialibacter TaxID=2629706 RepID=UPI001254ECC4|nr:MULTISPECIES: nucleotidyltransferase [unclassified Imperialibacter]CAD5256044.1 putative nucleotidyltransferase [Imperialibacter sp. 89]CAD5262136.1 putative nucleotidyltransferase [Imperialibacter sp. 75]VVT33082.1 conserved hypothetical protein [Imperialibacter sp. EC-SDR9]